ncbi:MAG: hypothetical protein ACE5EH_01675 [Gammaproteobacteria bacterium]
MSENFDELVFVCISYLLLSVFQGWLLNRSPTDHNAHLYIIRETRQNRWKLPASPTSIINSSSWGAYPLVLHFIIGKLPSKIIPIVTLLQASLFTVATGVLIVSYPILDSSVSNSVVLGLFLFSPFNFDVSNARNYGLGSRAAGQFFLIFFILTTTWLVESTDIMSWVISIFAAMCVIAFNTFALQALIIFCVVAVFLSNWQPLFVTIIGTICFFIIFGKYAYCYLRDTVIYWNTYRKYLAKVFILKNYPSYWLTPFIELPVIIKKNNWKRAAILIWKNTFVNSVLLNPLPWICVFILYNNVDSNDPVVQFYIAMFVAFFVTSIHFGRFWGEPHRYLEFLTPYAALMIFPVLHPAINTAFIYAFLVIGIQIAISVIMSRHLQFNKNELDRIEKIVSKKITHPVVFSNNNYTTKYFMKNDWKFIILWSIDRNLCGYKPHEAFENYPFIGYEICKKIISEYKPNVLILYDMEKEKISEIESQGYFSGYNEGKYHLLLASSDTND